MMHPLRSLGLRSAPLLALLVCAGFAAADEPRKMNEPPPGFVALFNGKDLTGWKGLGHFNPQTLRAMSPEERAKKEAADWEDAKKHWTVENGELVNDGHGVYLTTKKDYGDFELLIDYKTVPKADSGIYLRGTPQVQIWDTTDETKFRHGADKGSGALWNNKGAGKFPLVKADKPLGEWNHFRIKMVGENVTVWLNDQLVVNDAPLDNFWEKGKPVYPVGPLQLQTHGGEIRWRNIFIREIPRKPPEAGVLDKNGEPVGDNWQKPKTEVRDFELHATVSESPTTVNFRRSEDGEAYALAVSRDSVKLLDSDGESDVREVVAFDGDASKLFRDGKAHLYLRARAGYIEAWVNGTKVIDVLDPSGPKEGQLMFTTSMPLESIEKVSQSTLASSDEFFKSLNLYFRPATDWRDQPEPVADEEGFVPLFNGKDLTGWTGAVDGHVVENGVLVAPAKGGGNLYYDKEFQDFVLRFDFKLEAGGNNGVALRSEKGKNAAYYGMESQILDNTSPTYANLAPYQFHGSIYGVIPAKRGYLKPLGYWNSQEITVDGTKVTVKLNGETIVDGDIAEAGKPQTIDGREHPGLFNEKGYIGFLGHGHRIEFKNIRLKELK